MLTGWEPRHVYVIRSEDEIIYVGSTANPERRERQLRRCKFAGIKHQFEVVASFKYDRQAAFAYELKLIKGLRPAHNRQGNPDHAKRATA